MNNLRPARSVTRCSPMGGRSFLLAVLVILQTSHSFTTFWTFFELHPRRRLGRIPSVWIHSVVARVRPSSWPPSFIWLGLLLRPPLSLIDCHFVLINTGTKISVYTCFQKCMYSQNVCNCFWRFNFFLLFSSAIYSPFIVSIVFLQLHFTASARLMLRCGLPLSPGHDVGHGVSEESACTS